jgi:hypothetical protein
MPNESTCGCTRIERTRRLKVEKRISMPSTSIGIRKERRTRREQATVIHSLPSLASASLAEMHLQRRTILRPSTLVRISVLSGLLFSASSHAAEHTNRLIGNIEPPDAVRDCVFFTLQGVDIADPAVENNQWFAVPRSHLGFKEIYSALLMARATGALVKVTTTGTPISACSGHAGAHTLVLLP